MSRLTRRTGRHSPSIRARKTPNTSNGSSLRSLMRLLPSSLSLSQTSSLNHLWSKPKMDLRHGALVSAKPSQMSGSIPSVSWPSKRTDGHGSVFSTSRALLAPPVRRACTASSHSNIQDTTWSTQEYSASQASSSENPTTHS